MFLSSFVFKLGEHSPLQMVGIGTHEGAGWASGASGSGLGVGRWLSAVGCVRLVPAAPSASRRLGLLTAQRDSPQHQMADTYVRLSGQLRQKTIIICPVVQVSSLDRPDAGGQLCGPPVQR